MSTVLIVDDEAIISGLLSAALIDEGHETLLANNGSEGMVHIDKSCPHLVISDHMMPRMDGIELLKAVRAHATCFAVPFILMSGMGPPNIRHLGIKYSAFVKKPFALSEVVHLITGMLDDPN